MRLLKLCALALAGVIVTGCAAFQPPVPLSGEFTQNPGLQVGLALRSPETPSFTTEGNVGLLDYAIISAAMLSLKEHVKTLDLSEFKTIEQEIAHLLQQQGFEAQVIPEFPDMETLEKFTDPDKEDTEYYAPQDMTPFAKALGVDYLITLEVFRAGFARPYEGFIPMDSPRAVFDIRGQLIDLRSNRLLWFAGIHKANSPDGAWDEPPSFPGLTNSYYITLEEAKKEIIDTFSHKQVAGEDDKNISAKVDM
jgi:hypothetical protein